MKRKKTPENGLTEALVNYIGELDSKIRLCYRFWIRQCMDVPYVSQNSLVSMRPDRTGRMASSDSSVRSLVVPIPYETVRRDLPGRSLHARGNRLQVKFSCSGSLELPETYLGGCALCQFRQTSTTDVPLSRPYADPSAYREYQYVGVLLDDSDPKYGQEARLGFKLMLSDLRGRLYPYFLDWKEYTGYGSELFMKCRDTPGSGALYAMIMARLVRLVSSAKGRKRLAALLGDLVWLNPGKLGVSESSDPLMFLAWDEGRREFVSQMTGRARVMLFRFLGALKDDLSILSHVSDTRSDCRICHLPLNLFVRHHVVSWDECARLACRWFPTELVTHRPELLPVTVRMRLRRGTPVRVSDLSSGRLDGLLDRLEPGLDWSAFNRRMEALRLSMVEGIYSTRTEYLYVLDKYRDAWTMLGTLEVEQCFNGQPASAEEGPVRVGRLTGLRRRRGLSRR